MDEQPKETHSEHKPDAHDDGLHVHVVPIPVLALTWGGLILLTWVTVAATWIDMGSLNLWVAMLIATVKAGLVALYFMHLRWDLPFHGVVFLGSLVFVFLFVGIVLMDTVAYQPDLIP
jgi:cytochrome c oxidase subunit 4